MATSYSSRLPRPQNIINCIDAANGKHTSGSGNIVDARTNIIWSREDTIVDSIEDGVIAFDCDGGYFQTSASYQFGQFYTCFYLWKPKANASNWKTLHRNSSDHLALVSSSDKVSLGMYSNRNGAFRDCGYDIVNDVWQTLIFTGEGDSSTSTTGTTTFYVNGENVGTADRVACGTDIYRIGWSGQPPGKISMAGSYNILLNSEEITDLHNTLTARL